MSARLVRRRKASRPNGDLRSRTMPRFPRLTALKLALSVPTAPAIRRVESPPGGSTLITSAPISHSCIAQYGPAITWVMSTTRTPARALSATAITRALAERAQRHVHIHHIHDRRPDRVADLQSPGS